MPVFCTWEGSQPEKSLTGQGTVMASPGAGLGGPSSLRGTMLVTQDLFLRSCMLTPSQMAPSLYSTDLRKQQQGET